MLRWGRQFSWVLASPPKGGKCPRWAPTKTVKIEKTEQKTNAKSLSFWTQFTFASSFEFLFLRCFTTSGKTRQQSPLSTWMCDKGNRNLHFYGLADECSTAAAACFLHFRSHSHRSSLGKGCFDPKLDNRIFGNTFFAAAPLLHKWTPECNYHHQFSSSPSPPPKGAKNRLLHKL